MNARLLTLLAVILWLLPGCREDKPPPPSPLVVRYELATVTNPYPSAQFYIGIIKAATETDLSFKVPGIVELIGPPGESDWKEGTEVSPGTLLARLKQNDFTNNLKIAQADSEADSKQYARAVKLNADGAISGQEFDNLKARKDASEAKLANAQQAMRDSQIFAPTNYTCTILSRAFNAGQTVAAGKPVLRIGDLRRMSVEIGLPDKLVGRFRPGNIVPVTISALEGKAQFSGEVTEVGAAATEGRLFRVVIQVTNTNGTIKSGMTASVPVEAGSEAPRSGSVLVPLSALVAVSKPSTTNKLAVFVVEGDRVREQPVQTDDIIGSAVLIRNGVKPGDKIVVVGAATLYDGASVAALENTASSR
jgi:RND family efflux transporter MFP subunit